MVSFGRTGRTGQRECDITFGTSDNFRNFGCSSERWTTLSCNYLIFNWTSYVSTYLIFTLNEFDFFFFLFFLHIETGRMEVEEWKCAVGERESEMTIAR